MQFSDYLFKGSDNKIGCIRRRFSYITNYGYAYNFLAESPCEVVLIWHNTYCTIKALNQFIKNHTKAFQYLENSSTLKQRIVLVNMLYKAG